VELVDRDLKKILKKKNHRDPGRECEFSAETEMAVLEISYPSMGRTSSQTA